jgi:putative ubiquitin-RnfH superfamily antitoxin RatB of RatAB toxin-antitoxin module
MGHAERPVQVELVYSPAPRTVETRQLTMAAGSTLADAVRASGLIEAEPPEGLGFGIWGRRQPVSTVLRDGDRVEIYRALTVDPKEARRLRYKGQPARKQNEKRPARAGRS